MCVCLFRVLVSWSKTGVRVRDGAEEGKRCVCVVFEITRVEQELLQYAIVCSARVAFYYFALLAKRLKETALLIEKNGTCEEGITRLESFS